jgi:hypothetical protein
LRGTLSNRLIDQHLPHACFRHISPQTFIACAGHHRARQDKLPPRALDECA